MKMSRTVQSRTQKLPENVQFSQRVLLKELRVRELLQNLRIQDALKEQENENSKLEFKLLVQLEMTRI